MAPYTRLARLRHSAVSALHYELLSEIFLRAVSGHEDVKSGQEQLIILMLVCRQWRNAALGTPVLWSRFAFDLVGGTLEEKVVTQQCMLWISRAKTHPLSIDIFFRTTARSELSGIQDQNFRPKARIWEYLASVDQLRRIRLFSPHISCISGWYMRSWSAQQQLVIHVFSDADKVRGQMHRLTQDADVLDTVSMLRSDVESSNSSLSRPNSLTTLSLHARMSSTFVLRLLEESPALETCEIDMEQCYHPLPVGRDAMHWTRFCGGVKVVLPKLRTLKIYNAVHGQDDLARFVRVPNLRKLRLYKYGADIGLFLETCVAGSGSTLEHMDLRLVTMEDNRLLGALRRYPSLSSLTLYCLNLFDGSFLDALQLDENQSLLSKLRTLDIKGEWDEFNTLALVRFIKRRGTSWKRTVPTEEAKTLELATFEDVCTPKRYVRYDASEPKTKLMRTVVVGKADK